MMSLVTDALEEDTKETNGCKYVYLTKRYAEMKLQDPADIRPNSPKPIPKCHYIRTVLHVTDIPPKNRSGKRDTR